MADEIIIEEFYTMEDDYQEHPIRVTLEIHKGERMIMNPPDKAYPGSPAHVSIIKVEPNVELCQDDIDELENMAMEKANEMYEAGPDVDPHD